MKKLFILSLCLMAVAACDNSKKVEERARQERDSLMQVIDEKDTELNEIMGSINEVQEGFRLINEAEGRITVANGNPEAASSREVIRENMQFIEEAMQNNRNKIAQLKERLRTSTVNVEKLTKTIENLSAQLEEQNKHVQELQAQLAEKDVLITEQVEQIESLNADVETLTQENARKHETIQAQDKDLHTAWFVFGTKKELKEQKIIENGETLKSNKFNKDYFTKIDIRIDKEIPLYSKSAQLLTTHPAESYKLVKDAKGEYTLKIVNAPQFWATSRYLVIQVK